MEQGCTELFKNIKLSGPISYKIALRYKNKEPLVYKTSGPPGWIEHYVDNAYIYRDPVMMFAFSCEGVSRFN